jgi:hypothetical protein
MGLDEHLDLLEVHFLTVNEGVVSRRRREWSFESIRARNRLSTLPDTASAIALGFPSILLYLRV